MRAGPLLLVLGAAAPVPVADVEYFQPFEYGDVRVVTCGQGHGSHTDEWGRYSIDYDMERGTPVAAAADGVVLRASAPFGETGRNDETNQIVLRHKDGRVSVYRHLHKDGVLVREGQEVMRGDPIGLSGNSGGSSGPHLHFGIQSRLDGPSVPFRFADFAGDGSRIPKHGNEVTSFNFQVRYEREHYALQDALYFFRLAVRLECVEAASEELLASARIELVRPQKVLRKALEERDAALAGFEAAAEEAVDRLEAARKGGDVAGALRTAHLASKDFAASRKGKELERALLDLRREPGAEEALASLSGEKDYRLRVLAAFRAEREAVATARRTRPATLTGQVWVPLDVDYAGVPARYEKAVASAPARLKEGLGEHVVWLRGQLK